MLNSFRNAARNGHHICHRQCEKALKNKVIRQREKREWRKDVAK